MWYWLFTLYWFLGGDRMARFTLPRDIYHGNGSLEVLKTLKGKKAVVVVAADQWRGLVF